MSLLDKMSLKDKVAFVTGAGRNLGRIIALYLAEAGADVALVSRTISELKRVEEEIKQRGRNALSIPMDITKLVEVEMGVRKVVSKFGRIDILVNNATSRSSKEILEMNEEEWRGVIDTNLTAAFFCCKAVGPIMIGQGGGRVINISSRLGLQGTPKRVAYCAGKGGLIQLTRALALEWAPYKILVNSVAPGLMNTPTAAKAIQEGKNTEIPLKRLGEPEEIASMVVFLSSEAGSYVTGEVIVIDGGWAAK